MIVPLKRPWSVVRGPWSVVRGPWLVDRGLGSVVCGRGCRRRFGAGRARTGVTLPSVGPPGRCCHAARVSGAPLPPAGRPRPARVSRPARGHDARRRSCGHRRSAVPPRDARCPWLPPWSAPIIPPPSTNGVRRRSKVQRFECSKVQVTTVVRGPGSGVRGPGSGRTVAAKLRSISQGGRAPSPARAERSDAKPRRREWAGCKADEAGGAERSRRLREHPIRRVQRSRRSAIGGAPIRR